jgi:hypothetical protein
MKQHTTNYFNTFIEVSEDYPAKTAAIPVLREPKTIADLEYEMIKGNPYKYTSDDVIYKIKSRCTGVSREVFFSRGQSCFRASALAKRCGWGIHSDKDGKIAIYAVGTEEYNRLSSDGSLRHLKAMRNKKQEKKQI